MPDISPNNKPNNLQGAPKTSDKLIAMGTMALTNAPVLGAPLLNNINPAINPSNAGGIAVTLIGNGVLCFVQALSALDWFDDYKYAVWACIGFSVIICGGLYIFVLGNIELGVLNTLGAMHTAATGYGPFSKLGVFSRPGDKPIPQEALPPSVAPITVEHADEVLVNEPNLVRIPDSSSTSDNSNVLPNSRPATPES